MAKHKFIGYMCGTEFFYEEGRPRDGNRVFDTAEAVKKTCCCEEECGVVKVEVTFVEWETPQSGMMAGDNPKGEHGLKSPTRVSRRSPRWGAWGH